MKLVFTSRKSQGLEKLNNCYCISNLRRATKVPKKTNSDTVSLILTKEDSQSSSEWTADCLFPRDKHIVLFSMPAGLANPIGFANSNYWF